MPVSLLSGLQGTSAWPWPHSAYLAQMHMGKEPRFPDRTDFPGLSLGRSSAFLGPPFFFLENGVVTLLLMSAHTLHKDTVRIGRKAKISRLKSTPGLILSIPHLQPSSPHNNTRTRKKNVPGIKTTRRKDHSFPWSGSQVGSCYDSFFFFPSFFSCIAVHHQVIQAIGKKKYFSQNEGVICSICYFLFN